MTGPLLRFTDLSTSERVLFGQDLARRIGDGNVIPDSDFYLMALHSWGIICSHPGPARSREWGSFADEAPSFEECQWYACSVCNCIVINR